MTFAPDNNYLSSDQDTNEFLLMELMSFP